MSVTTVMCAGCESLTVNAPFCRGCGNRMEKPEEVNVSDEATDAVVNGAKFYPGPKYKWQHHLIGRRN